MKVVVKFIVVFISYIHLMGCDYLPGSAIKEVEYIPFNAVNGMQTDVNYQRLDVFNDYESYSNFLSQLSSYDAALPEFDAESQTLVSVISYTNPCSFIPEVTQLTRENQYDGSSELLIYIKNNKVDNAQCDTSDQKQYNVNFVTFAKTDDRIGLYVRNDNY